MPITSSARKALKQQARRAQENKHTRKQYKEAIKKFLQKPGKEALAVAYSFLDRAAKKNVIHRNKAKRLKSRLARQLKAASSPSSSHRHSQKTPH